MMEKVILGKTGLEVSRLGFGGLFFVSEQPEQQNETFEKAIQMGINYVDTAPGYGDSERILGGILKEIKNPLVISTKLGYKPEPFEPKNKDLLRRSVENSLKLLHRDCIDILFIHEPDRPRQFDWWTDMDSFSGPVTELIDELKKEGLIKYSGLGGTTAYELARIIKTGKFDVVLTAFNYSLLWREAEHAILPEAAALNMGIIAASPLQQGALAVRYDNEVKNGAPWMSPPRRMQYKALYSFLDETGYSLAELGIRFILSNPLISCILMGPRSIKELEENVAAVEKGPLPEDVLKRLNEIVSMVPFRPCEEPFFLPFNRPYRWPGAANR